MKKIILLLLLLVSVNVFAGFSKYLPVKKWYLKTYSDFGYSLEFHDDYTFELSYVNSNLKFRYILNGKYRINNDDSITLYSKPLQITYVFKLPNTSNAKSDFDLLTEKEKEKLSEKKAYSHLPVLIFKSMRLKDKSFKFHADNLSQNVFFPKK